MCKNMDFESWVPANDFDFRPRTIFQTETETKTWVLENVPRATDSENICFHAVR